MINVIWKVVETFIEEWRMAPYGWQNEIDLQAEITGRLRDAFKEQDKLYQKASYDYIRKGKIQKYSRVCCEWSTHYQDSKGKRSYCSPDIIVYDDTGDPYNPPDADSYKNWPLLWVCEIKYKTEDNSTIRSEVDWDKEKMKKLLNQQESKYACGLLFDRTKINKMPLSFRSENGGALRNYIIFPRK